MLFVIISIIISISSSSGGSSRSSSSSSCSSGWCLINSVTSITGVTTIIISTYIYIYALISLYIINVVMSTIITISYKQSLPVYMISILTSMDQAVSEIITHVANGLGEPWLPERMYIYIYICA